MLTGPTDAPGEPGVTGAPGEPGVVGAPGLPGVIGGTGHRSFDRYRVLFTGSRCDRYMFRLHWSVDR